MLIRELLSRGTAAITVRGKFVSPTEKDYFKCWHSANIIIQRPLCVMHQLEGIMCNYYFGILGGRYQLILKCIINIMFISLVGIVLRELHPTL